MSRRDNAIVAWHEVPGIAPPQNSRPVGYGMIPRVGAPIRRLEGGKFECGIAKQNRNYPQNAWWDQLRQIVPYPTGRFFLRDAFPGTSCQATISLSLRDKSHSPHQNNVDQGQARD